MNIPLRFFLVLVVFFVSVTFAQAGFFDSFINNGAPEIRYCADGEDCWLQQGITIVKEGINGLETTRTASEYIQDIVLYLLSFVTLIAVVYIIYAGFNILTGSGDEEKLKKSKSIIFYVILWIILMWLAWPITRFILVAIS